MVVVLVCDSWLAPKDKIWESNLAVVSGSGEPIVTTNIGKRGFSILLFTFPYWHRERLRLFGCQHNQPTASEGKGVFEDGAPIPSIP